MAGDNAFVGYRTLAETLARAAQVLGLLAAALEAGSDALAGHVLSECDLPGWLAAAPIWVAPLPRAGDARHVLLVVSRLHLDRLEI